MSSRASPRTADVGSPGREPVGGRQEVSAGRVRVTRQPRHWPGLDRSLDADLAVTTDDRSVLAEVAAARTGASIATVCPGLKRERLGVMPGQ